jgi:hypothetical protein
MHIISDMVMTEFFVATLLIMTIQLNLVIGDDIVMILMLYYMRQNKEKLT